MAVNILNFCQIFCRCPPYGYLNKILTVSLAFLSLYLCLYSLDPKASLPGLNSTSLNKTNTVVTSTYDGGNLLGLFILYVAAALGGVMISLINLPPLLGMLMMGFFLRNVPHINVAIYIEKVWSGILRNSALTIILIRAGLGLDPVALKKLSFAVVRLAFMPCLIEAVVEAVCARFLLKMPWKFCFMLGFVLAAVSPAVVVPSVLELERKGLGIDQGVNTLIIAASSIDDVLAISGFGVCMGLAFSISDNIALQVVQGPLEAVGGSLYGLITGLLLWFLPSFDNDKFIFYRTLLLYALAFGSMFGSTAFKVPGAGALGILVLSFVSGMGWRKNPEWNGMKNPVTDTTDTLWWLMQPFLFGLIGANLNISAINFKIIGLGVVTLGIGLVARLLASFLAVQCTPTMNLKERLFVSIAWLPKATVQAALGSVALDYAVKNNFSDSYIEYGELILAIAAVSILLTAPIGAILISLSAPFLLRKSKNQGEKTIFNETQEAQEEHKSPLTGFTDQSEDVL